MNDCEFQRESKSRGESICGKLQRRPRRQCLNFHGSHLHISRALVFIIAACVNARVYLSARVSVKVRLCIRRLLSGSTEWETVTTFSVPSCRLLGSHLRRTRFVARFRHVRKTISCTLNTGLNVDTAVRMSYEPDMIVGGKREISDTADQARLVAT